MIDVLFIRDDPSFSTISIILVLHSQLLNESCNSYFFIFNLHSSCMVDCLTLPKMIYLQFLFTLHLVCESLILLDLFAISFYIVNYWMKVAIFIFYIQFNLLLYGWLFIIRHSSYVWKCFTWDDPSFSTISIILVLHSQLLNESCNNYFFIFNQHSSCMVDCLSLPEMIYLQFLFTLHLVCE